MKKTVNITLDKDVLIKARELNINISSFTEVKLKEYIALLTNKNFDIDNIFSNSGRKLSRLYEKNELKEYLSFINVSDKNKKWLRFIERVLTDCLNYMEWDLNNKTKLLEFINKRKNELDLCTYRKELFQIRKFLRKQKIDYAELIEIPKPKKYNTRYIYKDEIEEYLNYFKNHKYKLRFYALFHLIKDSGLRPFELYQLTVEDLDLNKNIVYIKHDKKQGKTTKMKESRVSFFTHETKLILRDYIQFFNNRNELHKLFPERPITRGLQAFQEATNSYIHVKTFRKYFSQIVDEKNGNTGMKKILMGHSINGDVDLKHYSGLKNNQRQLHKAYILCMENKKHYAQYFKILKLN